MSPELHKHTPEAPVTNSHSPAKATPGRRRREPITTQAFIAPDVPYGATPNNQPLPQRRHSQERLTTYRRDTMPSPSQVRRKSGGGGATWLMKSRRHASTATWPSEPKVKTARF